MTNALTQTHFEPTPIAPAAPETGAAPLVPTRTDLIGENDNDVMQPESLLVRRRRRFRSRLAR